jgi:hypothetical protein
MTWDGHLPHTGIELAGLIVLGVFGLWAAQAGAGIWIFRKHQANDKAARADRVELKADAAAIRTQVVNGHAADEMAPKLRDDLDRIREDMRTVMATLAEWATLIPIVRGLADDVPGLRRDIAEVRKEFSDEVALERASRRDLARDVREDMARSRDQFDQLSRRRDEAG